MSEWSIELVLKTSRGVEPLESSNLSPTANLENEKMKNTIIEWQAKEFEHYEKGTGWYLTLTIAIVMLMIYLIALRDYFGALTILLIGAAIWFFSVQYPKTVTVKITNKGLDLDDLHVPYHNIKSFWIVNHAQAKAVHFETTAYLNRYIIVQLHEQEPDQIAVILKQYLPESTPNEETTAHKIARLLRF